jgi:hypothetical protein
MRVTINATIYAGGCPGESGYEEKNRSTEDPQRRSQIATEKSAIARPRVKPIDQMSPLRQ